MLPPWTRSGRSALDPDGYYARLGLDPAAPQASIAAAYRAKARLLHPDVPRTGNAEAFVAVKQAYDILSSPLRRRQYDLSAQTPPARPAIVPDPTVRGPIITRPALYASVADLLRPRPLSPVTITILVGLGAFLCLSAYKAASHLIAPAPAVPSAGIRPNAAAVEPLSPAAQRAVLYGPAPMRLTGNPNFYVVPAGSPAVIWRQGQDRNTLVPLGQLPPFSTVQAVRLVRQNGMLEVLLDQGTAFVSADHLTPGDARAARSAYCSYNAGVKPFDGEALERRGSGGSTLSLENRAVQPAVVKLRDPAGAVVVAVFLEPGGHADLAGLPDGLFRPEFAIGELWSRACNMFAAGMRARRMDQPVRLPGAPPIMIASDSGGPAAVEIPDQAFQQD